ncbi:MAG: extracellular solute-binding protein [Chloroflexi bacterium]|nr:extracellular solute-binding protein [Chloroflexota bacterium]MYF78850.1 extracellular solute-binding protein [Chloroflexota bacterium]MYK62434.1 extracellular solute-binding protein [Chloroflexota bacterium]
MISRRSSRSVAFLNDASMTNKRTLRAFVLSFALLTLSVAMIACGSQTAATPVVVEVERVVEVEKPVIVEKQVVVEVEKPLASPKTLTVYSGRSQSLVDPILEEFELLTGIPIEVRYASTGEMAATLLEEGDKSPADVFFAQDPGGLGAVKPLFMTLPEDIYDRSAAWASDPDNKWVGISGRARVIVYSTENISEDELPESIWDFTDPKWKGRIGFPPTNASFHVMVTAMRLDWSEEKTKQWLEGIMANDPIFYAKNTPTVAAAGAGEIDVGFVNHYYLHRFLAEEGEGFAARNFYTPSNDAGSLVMAAGAGILASTDAQEEAERLLKFLLGVTAQQYFATKTHEYPFNPAVQQSEHLPDLGDIGERFDIDLGLLDDLAGTQQLLQEVGALP